MTTNIINFVKLNVYSKEFVVIFEYFKFLIYQNRLIIKLFNIIIIIIIL